MPPLPNVPIAFGLNAAVLNHFAIRSCLLRPSGNCHAPITSAVSLPMPVSELSSPDNTLSGPPLIAFTIELNCQPPSAHRCHPGAPVLPHGTSHSAEEMKLCVRFKLSGP